MISLFLGDFVHQYEESVISNQMSLLIEYGQSYAFFKVVSEHLKENRVDLEFWVHLNNVTLNDLIIKWCKVFGTDDNELHWKKSSSLDGYTKQVRELILNVFDGNFKYWEEYRKEKCNFRNTYSAHRNFREYKAVPKLDKGFQVAACYFDFLVNDIGPWLGYQPYLSEYVENHKKITLNKLKI